MPPIDDNRVAASSVNPRLRGRWVLDIERLSAVDPGGSTIHPANSSSVRIAGILAIVLHPPLQEMSA